MQQLSLNNTLARSYLAYFIFSVIGLFADTMVAFDMHVQGAITLALIFFALGPGLIVWAQYTSRHYAGDADHDGQSDYFLHGPYRYLRNPTHLGILLLVTGYTFVSGSLIFFAITAIGYLISNVLFKKYESILHTTTGETYATYQTKVPKIF